MKVFPKNYGRGQLTPGDAGRFEGKFLAELIGLPRVKPFGSPGPGINLDRRRLSNIMNLPKSSVSILY